MAGIVQVSREFLPRVWPEVLRRWKFDHYPDDPVPIYQQLLLGTSELWLVLEDEGAHRLNTAIITNAGTDRDGVRSLLIHFACTRHDHFIWRWVDTLVPLMRQYATQKGCSRLLILARKGWHRTLRRFEGEPFQVLYGRDRPNMRTRSNRYRNRRGFFWEFDHATRRLKHVTRLR